MSSISQVCSRSCGLPWPFRCQIAKEGMLYLSRLDQEDTQSVISSAILVPHVSKKKKKKRKKNRILLCFVPFKSVFFPLLLTFACFDFKKESKYSHLFVYFAQPLKSN